MTFEDHALVDDVHDALGLAVRAPSIHNTQPWRWSLSGPVLQLNADRSRQLQVLDPDGRALLVSCGGALELATVALAAQGRPVEITRLPYPDQPDLLATITIGPRGEVDQGAVARRAAAERRWSDRRPFRTDPVPAADLEELRRTADEPGAIYASAITKPDSRLDLAVAVSWADRLEQEVPGYAEELARWLRPAGSRAQDGIPAETVPSVKPARRHTDIPLRDFLVGADDPQTSAEPPAPPVDEQPAYLVIFSVEDTAEARLRAGEAYTRVSVRAVELGLASSATTQALDLPGVRSRVRALMSWNDHPQVVLRIGRPISEDAPAASRRRPVPEILTIHH